jgi:hypothetical protein
MQRHALPRGPSRLSYRKPTSDKSAISAGMFLASAHVLRNANPMAVRVGDFDFEHIDNKKGSGTHVSKAFHFRAFAQSNHLLSSTTNSTGRASARFAGV